MGKRGICWLLLIAVGCLLTVAPSADARVAPAGGKAATFDTGDGGDFYGRGPQDPGEDGTDPDDPFELDRAHQLPGGDSKSEWTIVKNQSWNRLLVWLIKLSRFTR